MLIDHVKAGDRVEITLVAEGKTSSVLLSRVESIKSKNTIGLFAPDFAGKTVRIPRQVRFHFVFFTETGMVAFDGEVLSYEKIDGQSVATVKLMTSGERIQRREFFRYACDIPISFTLLNVAADEKDASAIDRLLSNTRSGILQDISGGGMQISSRSDVDEGIAVAATIQLGPERVNVQGKVIHREYNPSAAQPYHYRVQFIDISSGDQERIIQYIYNEQRRAMMRKR